MALFKFRPAHAPGLCVFHSYKGKSKAPCFRTTATRQGQPRHRGQRPGISSFGMCGVYHMHHICMHGWPDRCLAGNPACWEECKPGAWLEPLLASLRDFWLLRIRVFVLQGWGWDASSSKPPCQFQVTSAPPGFGHIYLALQRRVCKEDV